MIRVLFLVLAVVALALAFVLRQPFLFLVAIGLLGGAGALLATELRRRHRREGEVVRPPSAEPLNEDLKALGIIGIRPRDPAAHARPVILDEDGDPVPDDDEDWPGLDPAGDGVHGSDAFDEAVYAEPPETRARPIAPEPDEEDEDRGDGRRMTAPTLVGGGAGPLFEARPSGQGRSGADAMAGTVRKRARSARIMVENVSDKYEEEVVLSVLRALRAALDATTVTLLKQEVSPLGYSVEAIVSRNAFARSGGRFVAREPLVAGRRALDPLVLPCSGPDSFEARRLGYYHEPIAIHQVAFIPLLGPSGREIFLLVADTMEMSGLETSRSLRMLADFGRLIQSFIGRSSPRTKAPSGEPMRTRREIIAEEMSLARDERKPLALALVYLNRAEAIGAEGEGRVKEVDADFQGRLREESTGARIERFGELTYGIFRKDDAEAVSKWASELHVRLASEEGSLAGGISVGIAMLGDRHDGPDQLRSDATTALQESFETGECIILE